MQKNPSRAWSVVRAYSKASVARPGLLIVVTIATILAEAGEIFAPLYLSRFIDTLASSTPSPESVHALLGILALFATITLAGLVAQRIQSFVIGWVESRVMADLFTSSFEYILKHSHEFFISNFTGTLTRRITRYARAYEQALDNVFFTFFPTALFVLGVVVILSRKSLFLGLGLLIWTVVAVYAQYKMMYSLQSLRLTRTEEDSKVTGALSDAVTNHSTITSFASLPFESGLFRNAVARWHKAVNRLWNAEGWAYSVQSLLAVGIEVALLMGGAYLWGKGILSVGDFVLMQVYVLGLMNRVWRIGHNMREITDIFADAGEALDMLEAPHAIKDAPHATQLKASEGGIVFDRVHFEYHGNRAVLQSLDLSIAPHEKVALIGISGAGKTTVAKLLLRLYDLSSGRILIDGQDISQVTQESLRKAIALVPQEPLLFHRTLMENIRYGRHDATDAEVIEAARQANCSDFIARYPEGFQTMVGERGVKLSGGERQRVAIARAILKDAPILILDEATSSLDSESEQLIQDALLKLMQGKTVIAIAHRLSTIMTMDRIIVMEEGRVVLTGTHDELLKHESNLYKKLWEIQAGGFVGKE